MKTYSLWSNIGYSVRGVWGESRVVLIQAMAGTVSRVVLPFTGILLPKLVIDQITEGASPARFCAVVGAAAVLIALLTFIKRYTDSLVDYELGILSAGMYTRNIVNKKITMDYEQLESPAFHLLQNKTQNMASNGAAGNLFLRNMANLAVNVAGFVLYGLSIMAIHPLIPALLLGSACISWWAAKVSRDYEVSTRGVRGGIERKIWYISNVLCEAAAAKDIRLFSMQGWMKKLAAQLFMEQKTMEAKVAFRSLMASVVNAILALVRDGAAYFFLCFLLLQNRIGLGDFVFTFAAIGGFAAWVSGITECANQLLNSNAQVSDFRAVCNFPDLSNTGNGHPLPPLDKAPSIKLEQVTYAYPGSKEEALQNISVEIKSGERIAVVGVNGAGKTTLIKLITGLYLPKTGSISLAGVDIRQYQRDQYFTLFSTVFQDIHLLPGSIACNISQAKNEETDWQRLNECIRLAGLEAKIASLPKGADTMLVRQVEADAIELSGGEKQKLALARALYKNAPVLILDEPTAALDPIAESETYTRYAELTKGRTAIYISHRLASTRFCDRILFLDQHTIAEEGTHDELLRRGGKYAEMFEVQAEYYRNSEKDKDE